VLAREHLPPARGDDVQTEARMLQHLVDAPAVEGLEVAPKRSDTCAGVGVRRPGGTS